MTFPWLPHLNAGLNATAALLLLAGYVLIRAGRRTAHRNVMLTAFGVSVIFLCSYLLHHLTGQETKYQGDYPLAYFPMLISHIILAATVPVLAILVLVRAFRGDEAGHRRLARWTWPVWMYVSVTGILIWYSLYT